MENTEITCIETEFCPKFLNEQIRERVIFELASKKKRRSALNRFCHNTNQVVNEKRICGCDNYSENEIIEAVEKITTCKEWCLIAGKSITGTLKKVLETGMASGMGLAIVSTDFSAAVIREEQCFGAPKSYILKG